MKGLALETVVRWIILLVVAAVVISLVLFFYNDIKRFVKSWLEGEKPKAEVIEASKFSTSQVITYIKACWDKTGERFDENIVCYILKGDVSGVDTDLLQNALRSPAQVETSKFDPTKNVTIIRFEDIGNKVIVES